MLTGYPPMHAIWCQTPKSVSRLLFATLIFASVAIACSAEGDVGIVESPRLYAETYKESLDFAQVRYVVVRAGSDGSYSFDVTVRHNDEGWDHYANRWAVVEADSGKLLGERILAHPHETEQPFTRSQSGIRIPSGITEVVVLAVCPDHGYGGMAVLVNLEERAGEFYEIK